MTPPAPIKRLAVIQGHSVLRFYGPIDWRGSVNFVSDMDMDGDGVGSDGLPNNVYNDPYYQPRTSLKVDGHYLDSTEDRYIVLPPADIISVPEMVLGCQALVVDLRTGEWTWAVVGDVGPRVKDGEASIAVGKAIKINPSTVSGGVDGPNVCYVYWPGKAAYVNGKQYQLQSYGSVN